MLVKTTLLYCAMDANELESSGMEKDLGVLEDNKLKFDQHIKFINETVKKRNKLVGNGMITRYISFSQSRLVTSWYHFLKH